MYAYCWYEQTHGAFKFGVAQVPAERMVSYAVEFGLRPDPASLQIVSIPPGAAIRIHTMVIGIFIDGLDLKPVDGFAELYRLGKYNYAELKQLFAIIVRDIIMIIEATDGRKSRRLRTLAEDRIREWKDMSNGGSS
jgi:hypothetical protein